VKDNHGKFEGRPKIVPRFLFEGWSMADYTDLISRAEQIQKVADLIGSDCR
jgi:hypothetical protein